MNKEIPLPHACQDCIAKTKAKGFPKTPLEAINCPEIGFVPAGMEEELPCAHVSTDIERTNKWERHDAQVFHTHGTRYAGIPHGTLRLPNGKGYR